MSFNQSVFTNEQKKVLVLYDHHELHTKTIAHHLESFYRYSRHNFTYVSSFARSHFNLDYFDAVMVHYSVRVCQPGRMSASFARALRQWRGLKVLFIQDEYDSTHVVHRTMRDLGIGLVFTCVPPESIAKVYPPQEFPGVRFVNVLTGFVPLNLDYVNHFAPIRERSVLIGYRGRNNGYWHGDLGQEKRQIGERMKAICDERGLLTDIAWEEKDRIYNDAWFDFLGRCKATLGTESGANVFDFDGSLSAAIRRELQVNPNISYAEIRDKYLKEREGTIRMNQISPKLFEAIACRTALVLFEGGYSDILQPHRHYLPLKKDFSNVNEILAALQNDSLLEEMTERAHTDIIKSGRYSYQAFVRFVDDVIEQQCHPKAAATPLWLPLPPCDALSWFCERYQRNFERSALRRAWDCMPGFVKRMMNRERLRSISRGCPNAIRRPLSLVVQMLRAVAKPSY